MKPTNYHLFDFLDFDSDLARDEALWKACKPIAVEEIDGDIHISVPFQKQILDNDMAADLSATRENHTLVLRQYGNKIIRVFMGFGEVAMTDESEMLMLNAEHTTHLPLRAEFTDDEWIITTADGIRRAVINLRQPLLDRWSDLQPDPQETLDLRLYPDGKREIRLAAYDHFSPPRYDALPIAFCRCNGKAERATLSFECKHDECFGGTGERFAKWILADRHSSLKTRMDKASTIDAHTKTFLSMSQAECMELSTILMPTVNSHLQDILPVRSSSSTSSRQWMHSLLPAILSKR